MIVVILSLLLPLKAVALTSNSLDHHHTHTRHDRHAYGKRIVKLFSTGNASYYSSFENGKKTASGERYNPNAFTAASRTLPLGTMVLVSNIDNGKSVVVRINDRGPFVRSRILDVSEKAAKTLGITHCGVASVRITILNSNTIHQGIYG
jgi:rare lipoprotein A